MDVNPAETAVDGACRVRRRDFPRPMAEDKGLSFSVQVRSGTPDRLFVDEQRDWQRIVRNLLSNAVKFTSSGEVRLTVGRARPAGV